MSDLVYLRQNGPGLFLPDIRIRDLPKGAERWALCGYGHVAAVRHGSEWIGFWASDEPISKLIERGEVLVATKENCPINPS